MFLDLQWVWPWLWHMQPVVTGGSCITVCLFYWYFAEQPVWTAGETISFYIQLMEDGIHNSSSVFDDALSVSCVSPHAPINSSFCLASPSISMSGPGCYIVLLQVGTIW